MVDIKKYGSGLIRDASGSLTSKALGALGLGGAAGKTPDKDKGPSEDHKRARLGPFPKAMGALLGDDSCKKNMLTPLIQTKGILFPYTPNITFGAIANYQNMHMTHSNYAHWQFTNSAPTEISITAPFTAQSHAEGAYLVAVIQFLRSTTMMDFGLAAANRQTAGTPPPVLRFNYLGDYMFKNVPVVVTQFTYVLEDGIDYVNIEMPAGKAYVPTKVTLSVTLQVQQNTKRIREQFDLDAFKRGDLLNKGFV
jgi:hypothetical protein